MAKSKKSNIDGSGASNYEDETIERLSSKNLNKAAKYLTPKARLGFTQLKKAFTKALIFQHFDQKYHIQVQTDISNYAIGTVLSELTLNYLGQWHLIIYYLQKIVLVKT